MLIYAFDDVHELYIKDQRYFITKCNYNKAHECNKFVCTVIGIISGHVIDYVGNDCLCRQIHEWKKEIGIEETPRGFNKNSGDRYLNPLRQKQQDDFIIEIPENIQFKNLFRSLGHHVPIFEDYCLDSIIFH